MSRGEFRVIDSYAPSSEFNYGSWAQQKDFKPEVKKTCDAERGNKSGPSQSLSSTFPTRSAKVIIIGAPGVGKTSLVLRYCRDIFERNYKTTIGVDFEVEKYKILGIPFNMQIWDTAGADRFKGVTTAYFRGATVVVLAFDLENEETVYRTEEWLREAQEYCASNFEVFLVGTKKDNVSDHAYEEKVKLASQFADKYNAEYWYTSSRTGENVEELFTRIATLAFESVMLNEIALAASQRANTNGQITHNSSLIRIQPRSSNGGAHSWKKKACCSG